jgi:hypothetical protein
VAAVLVREPYNLTLREVADLTDWQIANVFFRKKPGEESKIVRPALSFNAAIIEQCRREGRPPPAFESDGSPQPFPR